jgi:hypothetical protein
MGQSTQVKRMRTKRKMMKKKKVMTRLADMVRGVAHNPLVSSFTHTKAILIIHLDLENQLQTQFSNRRQNMRSRCNCELKHVNALNNTLIKIKFKMA